MALDKDKVDEILAALKSADVTIRLKAIEEAQDLYSRMFTDEMEIADIAYSALVCEALYNIVRDILKENFKKISPAEAANAIADVKSGKSKPAVTKKKKIPLHLDTAFLAELKQVIGMPPIVEQKKE